MHITRRSAGFLVALACCAATTAWSYSDFPARPVRVVIGAAPGEPRDLLVRILAPSLTRIFGQRFVIDNQPGANGARAAMAVAKAPNDGYTLLAVGARFVTGVALFPDIPYDPLHDFAPIARIAAFPQVLVVNSQLQVRTLSEFVRLVRARPGQVTIASTGTGTTSHLAAELMKIRAGWLNALHVPYRGNGPALAGLMGNEVHALVTTVGAAHDNVKSGRLKALAVASAERVAELPYVPTFAEAGYPDVRAHAWIGIVAPAGAPYEAVVRLNVAIRESLAAREVEARFASQGAQVLRETPEQFRAVLHEETVRWTQVIKASGLAPEP